VKPARAVALLTALAACQPLPHPFARDVPPPDSPIWKLRDSASVSIAPIAGMPRATAEKLGPALANALQEREIAASDKAAGLSSYELAGHIQEMPPTAGKAALVALWELRDPSGKLVGERVERIEASAGDWQSGKDDVVTRLAQASASQLASLLQDEAPAEVAAGGRTRLRIAEVTGAPGDGDHALTNAITTLLQRRDVALVGDPQGRADLVLDASVSVTPATGGKQHVKIVWRVRRADGGEIGTVGQENDVPPGSLDAAWGDVAYMVAMAAQDGIMALVARGSPTAPPDRS
jgi:hypothetical protein